jgi:hypothetical protein
MCPPLLETQLQMFVKYDKTTMYNVLTRIRQRIVLLCSNSFSISFKYHSIILGSKPSANLHVQCRIQKSVFRTLYFSRNRTTEKNEVFKFRRQSYLMLGKNSAPKIIDPVFAKTSPKRSFCITENERFGLVFVKTGSINSGTALLLN